MNKLKRLRGLAFALLLTLMGEFTLAQVPQGIPYQAIARNGQGQALANLPVKVRFSILDSTLTGTAVYSETHEPTTSAQGLFSVNVGMGNSTTGSFNSINWGVNAKFLKVELDTTSSGLNYVDLGTQQMMSVPYALYSAKSGQLEMSSGTSNFNSNIYSNQLGFITSTNWVCPAEITQIMVELWGAGGGGANTLVNNTCGGCPYGIMGGQGGTGGYNKATISVIPGNLYSISIGTGGISGGGDGGSTSFSNLLSAEGGKGGASNGYPNCYGANGQSGQVINFTYPVAFNLPSFIPLGFTTLIPGLASGGASGGYMGNCNGPSAFGQSGQSGFCKISY